MNKINFKRFRYVLMSKRMTGIELAERLGLRQQEISMISTGRRIPKTDLLARICCVLKCYPSEICSFEDITINEKYFSDDRRQPLPAEAAGELTYKPLWMFLADYLYNIEGKTPNDLFDQIEPPRRIKQIKAPAGLFEKGVEARFGEGYKSERTKRTDYSKGLPAVTRTKLRNDRPLNLATIYEICKKLGCSVDFVLSYK